MPLPGREYAVRRRIVAYAFPGKLEQDAFRKESLPESQGCKANPSEIFTMFFGDRSAIKRTMKQRKRYMQTFYYAREVCYGRAASATCSASRNAPRSSAIMPSWAIVSRGLARS
jgi:hypothetical protein